MRVAYEAARHVLPQFSSKFSRQDFTWPQLFACLVLREHQRKSYRGTEALLRDVSWCRRIGMKQVPDHNTLCRAFHAIISTVRAETLLDLLARLLKTCRTFGLVLAIDSTYFDTHHHSRHYEHRCRRHASKDAACVNARRAAAIKALPKLALAVDSATHLILAARTQVGMSGDAKDFLPLLRQGKRRGGRVAAVVADSGYDSHENHVGAREELKIRSLIKADAGRPGKDGPTSKYRRAMKQELAGSQKGKLYGQRAQAETVNSMIKRNLGDALRARSPQARGLEQLLRVLTHNLMIIRCQKRVETEPDAASFAPPTMDWLPRRPTHPRADVASTPPNAL